MITTALAETLRQSVLYPVLLVEMDFVSGTSRAWSGYGDLEWQGKGWRGVGSVGLADSIVGIGRIEETEELRAAGLTLTVHAVDADVLAQVLDESDYQGREITVYFGLLSADQVPIDATMRQWRGYLSTMEVQDSGDGIAVTIQAEHQLIDLERARVRRYTDADQQGEFPGDLFYQYVASLQDKEIQA